MGLREVGQLAAAVRFAAPTGAMRALWSRVPADRWSTDLEIGVPVLDWLAAGGPAVRLAAPAHVREMRTNVDDEFLAWRFGTPLLAIGWSTTVTAP